MHILDCLDLKYTFTQGCTESAVPGEDLYVYITENLAVHGVGDQARLAVFDVNATTACFRQ